MRTYHRWLSVIFGLFILWIAATGVITQGARLYSASQLHPAASAPAPAARPPEAARPPQSPLKKFVHFVTELHSGEQFGIVGQLISLVAGLALIFFAISGMWMYLQMFRRRAHRHSHPRRLFW
jgi:uncharacterized iron-regulated membrane protein